MKNRMVGNSFQQIEKHATLAPNKRGTARQRIASAGIPRLQPGCPLLDPGGASSR
jgi:hypothetical protein